MSSPQLFPVQRHPRRYFPENLPLNNWSELEPLVKALEAQQPASPAELQEWVARLDELEALLQEDYGRRFVANTVNTADAGAAKRLEAFLEHISPHQQKAVHALQLAYRANPHRSSLDAGQFASLDRKVDDAVRLFRPENVPLLDEVQLLAQEYGSIVGAMSIEWEGQTYTLPQAGVLLQRPDRALREEVWRRVSRRRQQSGAELDALFDKLLAKRRQIAANAGFDSYTDYAFASLGRHDYGRAECAAFLEAVQEVMVPVVEHLHHTRRQRLGLASLRPWDLAVDPWGAEPLKPFADARELVDKGRAVLSRLDPRLGQLVDELQQRGHLDLESRLNKAPGGYNYPLHETGLPFIFMNAAGVHDDWVTLVHEAGHAWQSVLLHGLPFAFQRDVPSEVAELASMGLELLSMPHWDVVYPNPRDLARAQLQQLERCLDILPWVATVDAFQTWVYDHPDHSPAERHAHFAHLHRRLMAPGLDWTGLEDEQARLWHKQLHIFELPFYYIEYGIAQLGALQLWQNQQQAPHDTWQRYCRALALGTPASIPQTYAQAGVRFDFSAHNLRSLSQQVLETCRRLEDQL